MKKDNIIILDNIHNKIHALRKVNDYKPSIFESELNELIAEHYSNECNECKFKSEEIKVRKYQKKSSLSGWLFK